MAASILSPRCGPLLRMSCAGKIHLQQRRWYQHHPVAVGASVGQVKPEAFHARAVKGGPLCCNLDASCNYLLKLYSMYADLNDARKLFGEMLNKDVRTWTIMISGFARNGADSAVLNHCRNMQVDGVKPNQFTLSAVLKSCSSLYELKSGKAVHGWIWRNGIAFDVVLENSVLDLYVKCGALSSAEKLFWKMEGKDTVSRNIMIGAYLHSGDARKSLELFDGMKSKDVISWNTMLDGLISCDCGRTALEVLYRMVADGPDFNAVTFSTALNLVSCLSVLQLGKEIHGKILRLQLHNQSFIMSSLIDMYCKCGEMRLASAIFDRMCLKSLARRFSWSSMVSGYIRNGDYISAFETVKYMFKEDVEVDIYTLTSVVSGCATASNLELGRQIHAHVQKVGHKVDPHLVSSFVDMYTKCGCLNDALKKFNESKYANVVIWTSMISGFALHGQGKEAVELFELMLRKGITPNHITFLAVLNACSHGGLFEEGSRYFKLMQTVYGLEPMIEHYTCMVDLYARAGRLNEAKGFILENGISHLTVVWKSLLSSCRLHNNVEVGKWVCERLIELEPLDESSYILISNIFSGDDRWEEAAKARSLMFQRAVTKLPGQSWI
ncbi:Putative pentatricopeptide repeat-containing protein At1g68930 [Linum grandiflorum]